MLASNKKRARYVREERQESVLTSRPEGNDRYVRNAPRNPKETRWMYDDDVSAIFTGLRHKLISRLCSSGQFLIDERR